MARIRQAVDVAGDGRKPSLVDEAYAAMKDLIRDSQFPPGYQSSEQEIALRLGMSRTPVHEASIRLQEDGLVRVLPRRGILICALAPDDMREIYDIIIAIEGRAAALLAAQPEGERAAVVAVLTRNTDLMAAGQDAGDLSTWGKADEAFHRALVESAGNKRLIRIMQMINDQSHRARMLTLKLRSNLSASIAEHLLIIAAIRSGDAALAQIHAQSHRDRAQAELLPLLGSFGLKHI